VSGGSRSCGGGTEGGVAHSGAAVFGSFADAGEADGVERRGRASGGATFEDVFQNGEVAFHLAPDGSFDDRLGELEEAARLAFHDDVDS